MAGVLCADIWGSFLHKIWRLKERIVASARTYSAARLAPMDGGWRRCAGVCSEVRKRVYTCGVS